MTIKDIAREAGYSVGTVSRVLNQHPNVSDSARTKIMEVVEKNHFHLNRNAKHLKQQASSGLCIMVKGSNNLLFADLLEKMQKLIGQNGYPCLIHYIGEEDNEVEHALRLCAERRPLGILFLGSNLEYFQENFEAISVPCVLVTNSAEALGFANLSSVTTDDARASEAAVEHLIALGHRRIGVLGGKTKKSHAALTRYQGCERAFERNGILFLQEKHYEQALFSMSEGYEAMKRLLQRFPEVTAVFAMADVMAVGAIRAACDMGLRVPEDISVVGFDGVNFGNYLTPRLTTVRQDRELLARRSVEILLQCICEGKKAVHEVVPFQIISGESAKKLESA